MTAPDGARTRYELDARGQVTRITLPDGSVTAQDWAPEGALASRTFPDGTAERFWWDAEGNLSRYVNTAGGVTSYEHGPFDSLTAEVSPDGTRTELCSDHALRVTEVRHGGLSWHYDYDRAGRLAAETDYNGATTTYAYDAAGQLIRQANAVGQEIAFGYDVLGNMTERVVGGIRSSFGYDAAGNLLWARNPDAEVRFERDVLGRVITESCNGRSVRTSFDTAGRVAGRVTSSGLETSWEFDTAGRPVAVTAAGRQLRFGYNTGDQETRRELLARVVEQAQAAGAGLIALPVEKADGEAIPASYTVSEWRDQDPEDVAPLDLLNAIAAASAAQAEIVDVDGQPALREETVESANPEAEPLATHPGRRVTYTVSAPDSRQSWVIFTFITLGDGDPDGPLAHLLVELFDAHLTTLRWKVRG